MSTVAGCAKHHFASDSDWLANNAALVQLSPSDQICREAELFSTLRTSQKRAWLIAELLNVRALAAYIWKFVNGSG